MKKLTPLIAVLVLTGCSSTHVALQPNPTENQEITFLRGRNKLNSKSLFKPELAVLEYSEDEMVVSVGITNFMDKPLIVSENNLTAERYPADKDEKIQQGTIYHFEDLAEEAADSGYNTSYQVGDTAASIGASFVPFGGIVYAVGRLFYSLGSQHSTASHDERVDQLTFSQLNQNYFRQQTVAPKTQYSGILKIGFEDDLEVGDVITFKLHVNEQIEQFSFTCEQPEKK